MPRFKLGTLTLALALSSPLHAFAAPLLDTATPAASADARAAQSNAWLEIVLDEGRNRQIRRLLAAHGLGVVRLVRVAIGPLALGDLAKGAWRALTDAEVSSLAPPGRS